MHFCFICNLDILGSVL